MKNNNETKENNKKNKKTSDKTNNDNTNRGTSIRRRQITMKLSKTKKQKGLEE